MLEIEKFTPKEGWYIGLIFKQGCLMMRLLERQQRTKYAPWSFNSGTAIAVDSMGGWETPTDSSSRYYLEPSKRETIYQVFMGISPSTARIYSAYPERVDRMNLISVRSTPGSVGYWDGEDSPYRDPSPETEHWVLHDMQPYFNAENNGVSGASTVIKASWYINPYSYKVITNPSEVEKFLTGQRKATIRTMGDPDRLIDAPQWVLDDWVKSMVHPEDVI